MMAHAVRPRLIVPEVLDELAADDPRAQRSRRDLRTVHAFMRSPAILGRLIAGVELPQGSRCRVLELGAGDGTLTLRAAARLEPRPAPVELTLLDRVELLADSTRAAYRRIGWEAHPLCVDVLDWAQEGAAGAADGGAGAGTHFDLCIASLFLHHFRAAELGAILRGVARRADALVCLEPRRSALAELGARCIGVLGVNAVTRGDALKSVRAGFNGRELSEAWSAPGWRLEEFAAPPFTHCFVARRTPSAGAPGHAGG